MWRRLCSIASIVATVENFGHTFATFDSTMRGDPKPRRMSRSGVPTRVSSTVSPMWRETTGSPSTSAAACQSATFSS
jgi:hypothetical protein